MRKKPAGRGETVLVVDDEPSVRMLVGDVLEGLGYAAIEAADSISGLSVLQSEIRVDLLITDVGLPGGMNGRQLAEVARRIRPDLPVLFMTGHAENAAIATAMWRRGCRCWRNRSRSACSRSGSSPCSPHDEAAGNGLTG
jgi:CheY-like chemotaxis protein